MKKKKQPFSGFVIILLITAAIILLVRHFHIQDFCIVKPGVLYASGQPRGMDYTRLLYRYHVATIVNVRSAAEHRERNWHNEEITWVRSNGVKYVEMPVEKNYFPDEKTQGEFLGIMADKVNLPVLLHGDGDERVAMLSAVWLIKKEGLTAEEAIREAEKMQGKPLTEAESKFIRDIAN